MTRYAELSVDCFLDKYKMFGAPLSECKCCTYNRGMYNDINVICSYEGEKDAN